MVENAMNEEDFIEEAKNMRYGIAPYISLVSFRLKLLCLPLRLDPNLHSVQGGEISLTYI